MKVAQLIEALKKLPPDLPVIAYANSHTTSVMTTLSVGRTHDASYNREVVTVGNPSWGYDMIPIGSFFRAEHAGELLEYEAVYVPEKEVTVQHLKTIPARWETVKK